MKTSWLRILPILVAVVAVVAVATVSPVRGDDTLTMAVPYSSTLPTTIGSGIDFDLINQQRYNCMGIKESDIKWLDSQGAVQTTATIELVTDYQSLARTLNLEVDYKSKADVSIAALKGGASVNLNVKYDSFAKDESRSLALIVKAQSDYGRRGLSSYPLDPKFQALLDAKDYQTFRQRCGTHTVVIEHHTAMIAAVVHLSDLSASAKESLATMFSSSGNFSGTINVVGVSANVDMKTNWSRLIETASRLGRMKVEFESRGGLGIPDAVKLAITNDPTKIDLILGKLSEVGASFTKENSAVAEYGVLPNTAFGLQTQIVNPEKLERLNSYYLQLSKVDFALKRIGNYQTVLPAMYTQNYIPAVGQLKQARAQLVALIEGCVLHDVCNYLNAPGLSVLYLEDVIQPETFEMRCFYKQVASTSGNIKLNVLSNAALVLTGKARLTNFVSVPNAIISRLADSAQGSGSPIFQTFSMSKPDNDGTARFVAQVDSFYFEPVTTPSDNSVTVSNLNDIVAAQQKALSSVYEIQIQATNGQVIVNSVGPAYGGNCPVEKGAP